MKNRFVALLMIATLSSQAFAECDFASGIQKMADGTYSYSSECHKKVGKLVLDAADRETQVTQKDVQLQSLGVKLDAQEKRAQLWMDTSLKLEDRVNQMESMKSTNQLLYFGLGVLTIGVSAWALGQATKR